MALEASSDRPEVRRSWVAVGAGITGLVVDAIYIGIILAEGDAEAGRVGTFAILVATYSLLAIGAGLAAGLPERTRLVMLGSGRRRPADGGCPRDLLHRPSAAGRGDLVLLRVDVGRARSPPGAERIPDPVGAGRDRRGSTPAARHRPHVARHAAGRSADRRGGTPRASRERPSAACVQAALLVASSCAVTRAVVGASLDEDGSIDVSNANVYTAVATASALTSNANPLMLPVSS